MSFIDLRHTNYFILCDFVICVFQEILYFTYAVKFISTKVSIIFPILVMSVGSNLMSPLSFPMPVIGLSFSPNQPCQTLVVLLITPRTSFGLSDFLYRFSVTILLIFTLISMTAFVSLWDFFALLFLVS